MSITIAAPPFQATLFFKTKDGAGFSESYWINKASYQEALDEIVADGKLIDLRTKLFTDSHVVDYVKVSDTTKKRDTLIADTSTTNFPGQYNPTAGDTAPDDDALMVRWQGMFGGVPYFALRELRLIPEEVVTDGEFVGIAAWNTAFTNFATYLKSASCVMVVKVGGVATSGAITDVVRIRMSQRKVGRPFGQSVGRSRRP